MSKNKRSSPPKKSPAKSGPTPEQREEALIHKLYDMAIDLVEQEDGESMSAALQETASDFQKLIKKCLYQKNDTILYEALDHALHVDHAAYRFLRDSIAAASEIVLIKRGEAKTLEINAFVIPLFVRTTGGLDSGQSFQDTEAFDALMQSFKDAQLESPDATVVVLQHAYHMDEIDSVTYCHINEMVCEAYTSMTDMRSTAIPAIERSFGEASENNFAPGDPAVELRFLLGFALKNEDDEFYQVPEDEAGADHYFAIREARFQRWCEQAAPLVARCLVTDGADTEIDFLYQDMFHGGKERGIAEYFMLQMLSELNQGLDEHGITLEQTRAIVGPAKVGDTMVLRVQLLAHAGDNLLVSADKPVSVAQDLQTEVADTLDALLATGVKSLSLATGFDAEGRALEVRAYQHRAD